ncbi:MAG TPA: PRC-barrel domain-containing protein [Usitatibacter sp.]|nr:PRC-barrel domain-containing protein [Usitatibacter sp.]
MKKKAGMLAVAAMLCGGAFCGAAWAQGSAQTVEIVKVDVQKLSAGYRASKVIGSSVMNDANQAIGTIDDLLISTDRKDPYAVLSVGGFLGMGTHLVVVPYASLEVIGDKVILPGGTKATLGKLPEFQFAAK